MTKYVNRAGNLRRPIDRRNAHPRVTMRGLVMAGVLCLGGCGGIKLISEYDEVIDRGAMEFAEQFNTHIKNMGDEAGTPEGTYPANLRTYNALDAKLDVLSARAASAAEGKGCQLEQRVFARVSALLQDKLPVEIKTAGADPAGNADGCNERLLLLVKQQMDYVRQIHRETDKCKPHFCQPDNCGEISCLRPATIKDALAIANQSITAVSVIESAKKRMK